MAKAGKINGFAFWCNPYGEITSIAEDHLPDLNLRIGTNLNHVLGSENQVKLFEFLASLRTSGILCDWEFQRRIEGGEIYLRVSGLRVEDQFIIIGQLISPDTIDLYREFMKINNEQTNTLRRVLKEKPRVHAAEPIESDIFSEISRINNELINLQRELAKKNNDLQRLNQEVQGLSITDELTGQLNRRGFFQKAEQEWNHSLRYDRPLTMIMFDIDHFKKTNDEHGHTIGDKVLEGAAYQCACQLRKVDIFCRYGGEEFCLLLPETTLEQGVHVAEKLRETLSKPINTEAGPLTISISLGVAQLVSRFDSIEDLIQQADKALYEAKNSGRNCTRAYSG